jgi:S-adenosylmethionine:tRNA ribosyltransferase-isomerase
MKRAELFYELPSDLIAQYPLQNRSQARLLVVHRASGQIDHSRFDQLQKFLPSKSFLVVNDSKVIPARLLGTKERSGGKVEIFLLKKLPDEYTYEALLRPLSKIKNGDIVRFENSRLTATVTDTVKRLVRFNFKNIAVHINKVGHMPLPPYIKRADDRTDREYYQTVYAKTAGSVAAPTAGLHFTGAHLAALKKRGHETLRTTLHVNYATFKEIEEDDVFDHQMHFESYDVAATTWRKIQDFRKAGKQAVAVGTTSCRVIESIAKTGKTKGETDLFIYPGYQLQVTDALITNFHLPYSSLLLLVYAFGGTQLIKKAYQEAIREKYRFFSYGDAMLII